MSPHTDFGATLESQTETYLGKLTECTDLLPTVLTAYADGEEYAATTTQIEEIESECDQLRRDITASISVVVAAYSAPYAYAVLTVGQRSVHSVSLLR